MKRYITAASNIPSKINLAQFESYLNRANASYYYEVTDSDMKAALSDALSDLTFALDEIPNDYPVNLVDIDTLCNKRDSHGAEYIVKLIYNVTVYGVSIYKNIPRIRNDYDLKKFYYITIDNDTRSYDIRSYVSSSYVIDLISIIDNIEKSPSKFYISQPLKGGSGQGYCKSEMQVDELTDALLKSGKPGEARKSTRSKGAWPISKSTIKSDAKEFLFNTPGIKFGDIEFIEDSSDITLSEFLSEDYSDGDMIQIGLRASYQGNDSEFALEYEYDESDDTWINLDQEYDRSDFANDILDELGAN